MGRVAILIVAGGRGLRAGGGIPKQYRDLAGHSLLRRTIAACLDAADLVQVVIGQGDEDAYARAVEGFTLLPPTHGGANRQESVCRGL